MKKFKICVFLLTGALSSFCNAAETPKIYLDAEKEVSKFADDAELRIAKRLNDYIENLEAERDKRLAEARAQIDLKIEKEKKDLAEDFKESFSNSKYLCEHNAVHQIYANITENKLKEDDLYIDGHEVRVKKDKSLLVDLRQAFNKCLESKGY